VALGGPAIATFRLMLEQYLGLSRPHEQIAEQAQALLANLGGNIGVVRTTCRGSYRN
jgi:hypothetical protein